MKYECLDCFFATDSFDMIVLHRRGYDGNAGHKLLYPNPTFRYATKRLEKTPPFRTDLFQEIEMI